LTGRTMRKVDGLFLSAKSKKEVNYNDKGSVKNFSQIGLQPWHE